MFDIVTTNPKLLKLLESIPIDPEIKSYWVVANINAIDRAGITDHGKTHIKITVSNAMKLWDILNKKGIRPNLIKNFVDNKKIETHSFTNEDVEVVIFLATVLHDIGISIHRDNHAHFSLILANNVLDRILPSIYPSLLDSTIIKSEILHAINAHSSSVTPLTLEASIVRLADALDMTKGRAKITYRSGNIDDHSISSMAIEDLQINSSNEFPIVLDVTLSSVSGLFMLKELLPKKLKNTALEGLVKVNARIIENGQIRFFKDYDLV